MPDQTYAQELLAKPIPLEHRLAYLPVSIDSVYREQNSGDLAKALNVSVNWITTTAAEINVLSNENGVYPPYAKEVLEEELRWDRLYDELGERVSLERIADLLGRKRTWVQHWAADIGSFPRKQKLDRDREVLTYETGVLYQLRHVVLAIMPANGWVTAKEIARLVGVKRETAVSILEKQGVEGETRRSIDGREFMHYPPESVEIIERDRAKYAPAGDWLSAKAMANTLGKDWDWVSRRVEMYEGKELLDDNGRPSIHYDPSVLEALRTEVNRYEYAEAYLGLRGLATAVGKSTSWVTRRLPYISVDTEEQLDKGKRLYTHYHPDAVNLLLSLPATILKTPPEPRA